MTDFIRTHIYDYDTDQRHGTPILTPGPPTILHGDFSMEPSIVLVLYTLLLLEGDQALTDPHHILLSGAAQPDGISRLYAEGVF